MRLISTRNPRLRATFAEAIQRGTAPDGGLYVHEPLPCFRDVPHLLDLDFQTRSGEIVTRMLGEEFAREDLEAAVRAALDFPVPLVQVQAHVHILELFHGPTLAFKDFGARFLARMLALLPSPGTRTVLAATSGDTGAAAAHALWRVPGVRAVVLYPKGRISALQERLFTTLGENVIALAVDGTFDDCQALVKACFADEALARRLHLTSANSINIARVLGQVLYYFEAVAQLRAASRREAPVFCVPSGNFGNLYAGLLAQRMGLPVKAFVAATNANDVVPRFLETGTYEPRPATPTLSNAMDVGAPSNWERIRHLFGGDLEALRGALRWGSLDDAGTRKAMWELRADGYIADPHTAVAQGVLQHLLGLNETAVILATAHPAKFHDILLKNMGLDVPLPEALKAALERPVLSEEMGNDAGALKERLVRD
jgi:threonine synthase